MTLAGAVFLATLLSLAPSHATPQERMVSAYNNYFDAEVTDSARVGDTITFAFQDGIHDAVAYRGLTFNSGLRSSGDRVSFVFDGGVIRYRCLGHSSLNNNIDPPICTGMCGVIADRPVDIKPPSISITSPQERSVNVVTPLISTRGEISFPIVIEGRADDDVGVYGTRVRVYDAAGRGREFDATCDYCPGRHVSWTATVPLAPGFYTAEALGADISGNRVTSKRVQFVLG